MQALNTTTISVLNNKNYIFTSLRCSNLLSIGQLCDYLKRSAVCIVLDQNPPFFLLLPLSWQLYLLGGNFRYLMWWKEVNVSVYYFWVLPDCITFIQLTLLSKAIYNKCIQLRGYNPRNCKTHARNISVIKYAELRQVLHVATIRDEERVSSLCFVFLLQNSKRSSRRKPGPKEDDSEFWWFPW